MVLPVAEFTLPLPKLTLLAVFDILVVAFLIYQALIVVRGTRAAHVLAGIATLGLLYGLSVWGGLDALNYLLSFIVPYTALALIILFHSEIRRTLGRIGWWGPGYSRPEYTDEILLALSRLSQERTGALIVLEKDTGLRTFIESGVRLDAQISRDLLLAIFHPGGALHDGAVILQKDVIAAANCFLPLSTNPALSAKLGTRHRAGIGITEESDALVIIVSEETGQISLAAFGHIEPAGTLQDLDHRISAHFGAERPGAGRPGRRSANPAAGEPDDPAPPERSRKIEKARIP